MFNNAPSKPRTPSRTPPAPEPPVRRPQLWSPTEWVLLSALNIAVFAFFLGQEKYAVIAELLMPAIAFGALVILLQWAIALRGWLSQPDDL